MNLKKNLLIIGANFFATAVLAQSYSIDWFSIGGGGGTSAGEGYSMSGTIGDSGAGNMTGGGYALDGGFWSPDPISDPGAQFVADGTTNTLDSVTNFIAGDVTVGNNGPFTLLILTNSALLTNSGHGYLGRHPGANANAVRLDGANTRWLMSGNLYVGSNGAFNQLVLSNAATVSASNNVFVGFNSSASNNFMSLSSGAWLTNGGDGVVGWNPGANANSAFVSGTNSRWQVGNSLYVGSNGAFNQLVISNAGTLISGSGLSVFTGGGLYVGASAAASNNLLSLSAGAQMTNGGNIVLGLNAGANSNTVSVSGANTRWQMLPYAYLYVGNSGAGNRLVISNGAQVKQTGNTVVNIGFNSSAINNEVVVTGTNSLWTMNELTVGLFGAGSHLVISDGARVETGAGWIGPSNASPPSPVSNNVALVTGPNSRWTMSFGLVVGNSGSGSLVISNGGGVNNFAGIIGAGGYGNNNSAVVTGANSYWSNTVSLYVGQAGSGCSLVISNGAWVDDTTGMIGLQTVAVTNEVVVTGAGSVWNNRSDLYVGNDGVGNRLLITDGGKVFVANKAYVGFGFYQVASNNLLTVSGGSLIVTNPAGSGALDVRYGTNVLNTGLIEADRLILTNATDRGGGWFNLSGGTLKTKGTTNNNGRLFAVGNGTTPAIFELVGNGLHTFNNGLAISNNATLRGNGSISGPLAVAVGGTLSPGTSVGKMVLNSPPALLGNVTMEISRSGATLTNDQVQVAGALTYGGSLAVSHLGPSALTAGNSFQLFSASGYSGAFASITLPPLNAGLTWTNKLSVDGSIQVVGSLAPQIGSLVLSGTNLVINGTGGPASGTYLVLASTNVALPLANWTPILTNQFNAGGDFVFTNGISPGVPQRFYVLQVP